MDASVARPPGEIAGVRRQGDTADALHAGVADQLVRFEVVRPEGAPIRGDQEGPAVGQRGDSLEGDSVVRLSHGFWWRRRAGQGGLLRGGCRLLLLLGLRL